MVLNLFLQIATFNISAAGIFYQVDVFDIAHRIAAIALLITFIVALYVFLKIRSFVVNKAAKKNYDIDSLNKQFYALMIIIAGMAVAIYIDGIVEIVAGVIAIAAAIWLLKSAYNRCKIRYLYVAR